MALRSCVGTPGTVRRTWKTSASLLAFTAAAATAAAQTSGPQVMHWGNLDSVVAFLDTTTPARPTIREWRWESIDGSLLSMLDTADAPGGANAKGAPLRVLFVGNSLTYYHRMPRGFAALAAAGLHRRVVVGLVSVPGASGDVLWEHTDVRKVLQRLPWEHVVIQFRPYGFGYAVPLVDDARHFGKAVTAQRGHALVWTQYRGPETPAKDQAALDADIAEAARAGGAGVLPVPAAWEAVRRADAAVWQTLFEPDGHPSAVGSYLIALVTYRAITGQSPVGLPHKLGEVTIADHTAEVLQRVAASVRP